MPLPFLEALESLPMCWEYYSYCWPGIWPVPNSSASSPLLSPCSTLAVPAPCCWKMFQPQGLSPCPWSRISCLQRFQWLVSSCHSGLGSNATSLQRTLYPLNHPLLYCPSRGCYCLKLSCLSPVEYATGCLVNGRPSVNICFVLHLHLCLPV